MSDMIKGELHCHSTASDGVLSPMDLIALAIKRELKYFTITDHDSVAGILSIKKFFTMMKKMTFLSGTELSSHHRNHSIHVLGYGFRLDDKDLTAYFNDAKEKRKDRAKEIIDRLMQLGKPLAYRDVTPFSKGGNIGRPHIARAMMASGLVSTMNEAFDLYLGNGKPAHIPSEQLQTERAVELIQNAGGVAVLAHPGIIEDQRLVHELMEIPFDGIEVNHPSHSRKVMKRLKRVAKLYNKIQTAGSDFHAPHMNGDRLGEYKMHKEHLERLLTTIESRYA